MKDSSGAYIVTRSQQRGRQKRSALRPVGVLIATLLILSVIVCVIVFFLTRESSASETNASGFTGKTYYFMYTTECTEKVNAEVAAADAAARGGAGYVFNDGTYKVVAAVYAREADVKTLVSVNPDSAYFSVTLHAIGENASAALDYLCGEWFDTVYLSSSELDRGNITEAAAEHAVVKACDKLLSLVGASGHGGLCRALESVSYDFPNKRTVLSSIRYITAEVIAAVSRLS